MWTLKEQAEHNLGRLNSDLDAIRQTKAVARIYWAISLVFGAYIVSFIDKFQIVTSPDLLEISVGITFMVISASFLYANGLFFFMVLKSEEIFAPPRFHLFKNQVYDKVASSEIFLFDNIIKIAPAYIRYNTKPRVLNCNYSHKCDAN